MFTTLLCSLAIAASPAERFVQLHPGSAQIRSADGQVLSHASGFLAETGARTPQDAARAFLAAHGNAFGIGGRQVLELRAAPRAGEAGPVRFARTIDGLPVFGGDVVVGVDGANRVFLVNAGGGAVATVGRHALGASLAERAALAAFPSTVRGAGRAMVAAGWHAFATELRAVYQVDFIAREPAGDWRVLVDGETGATLFRYDMRKRATAPGTVFEVSPAETASGVCTPSNGKPTLCAATSNVTLANLATGADLKGTQTSVFNCNGANAPTASANVPGTCANVTAQGGAFNFGVDNSFVDQHDNFAAEMAYFHLDKHVSFFKKLDAAVPPGPGQALRGSLPALVNVLDNGAGFENAFFSPLLDAMVFGQGAHADYAYDATVMYHEFTHGVVSVWGGFNPEFDPAGTNWEAPALNEGTADAMAVSETGHSGVGGFLSAVNPASLFGGRDLADPNASRSCQGDGTVVSKLGAQSVNGLDGEEHDDGEIWNGFFWEVFDGLRSAGIKGCGGACEAGAAIQYQALQLAAGTAPTFGSYWQTFKSAATTLFPSNPGVATYVECVAKRRKLDKCDRTLPLFAGESKVQFVSVRFSSFQVAIPTTGNATLNVCSGGGSAARLYGRLGQPVQITNIDSQGNATVQADGFDNLATRCANGTDPISLDSGGAGGTWFLLIDLGSQSSEIFRLDVGSTNVSARPATTALPTCTMAAPLAMQPEQPHVPPRAQVAFTATGGSGSGRTFSLATNASGATINASTGAYRAGATGNVTDVVKVTDSGGNAATQTVSVGAGVSISPAVASTAPGGSLAFTASGGSGTGFAWSLSTNASGGTINAATGAYTAGQTGSVTDVVTATDSLGNTATLSVSISAAPKKGGCSTTGLTDAPILALALALLLRPRRKERTP